MTDTYLFQNWKKINTYSNYIVSDWGNIINRITGHQLKLKTDKDGYKVVNLCGNGPVKTVKVHRLVAIAFIKNPEQKEQVNHIDGKKDNNYVANLEWCTQCENQKHSYAIGLGSINCVPQIGEKNYAAKFKNCEIWLMKKLLAHGVKTKILKKMFNTNKDQISCVRTGKSWKSVVYIKND